MAGRERAVSGADSYGEVAAGLALVARRTGQQASDVPPVLVAGKKEGGRWKVLAMIGGFQVTMGPAAARALAGELIEMAHRCECDPATVPALARDPSTTTPPSSLRDATSPSQVDGEDRLLGWIG